MKKGLSLILILSLILSMTAFGFSADTTVNLTIVHTNDTHARVVEDKSAGMGFAKIATEVKRLRAENPNTLVLDAGDTLHGQTIATLTQGEAIVKIMNEIGYNAMTPGNHDFNYGQNRLLELKNMLHFPMVSSNVIKADGSSLLSAVSIQQVGGIKVAILGVSTPETAYMTHPNNVKGLTFVNPIESTKRTLEQIKGHADVVIVLSHLGLSPGSEFTSKRLAEEVPGIDLIIDGHSHTVLEKGMDVNGTLIVQTGDYDKNLGVVKLAVTNGKVAVKTASLIKKEATVEVKEDAAILKLVADLKKDIDKITLVNVGKTSTALEGTRAKVRTGETNLGNYIADAMLDITKADVAFTNGGGIRASIDAGDITKGEVITVLPFGNYVVTKAITGADLWSAVEVGITDYPAEKGAFPHVAGMSYKFDPKQPAGKRLTDLKVQGKTIDLKATYTVATNDFIAAGGDGYTMFTKYPTKGEFQALDEVLIAYLAKVDPSSATTEGRVTLYDGMNKEATVIVFPAGSGVKSPSTLPAVETTPAKVVKEKSYVVQSNDVLWKIAEKHGLKWEVLSEYNKLQDPNFIVPGQTLLVPVQ